jgi:hypothetical protein
MKSRLFGPVGANFFTAKCFELRGKMLQAGGLVNNLKKSLNQPVGCRNKWT